MPRARSMDWFLRVYVTFLALNCPVAIAAETQILSFTGVHLDPLPGGPLSRAEYIASFSIKTWGVKVLAVCHIPGGWTVTAGKNANPEGELSGSAGEGVAFLDAGSLHQLTDFFLVQVEDYHPTDQGDCAKKCTPATFAGEFYIGQYGSEAEPRAQRLAPSNIRLTPADKCPDPP